MILNEITNEVKRVLVVSKKRDVIADDLLKLNKYYDEVYGSKSA